MGKADHVTNHPACRCLALLLPSSTSPFPQTRTDARGAAQGRKQGSSVDGTQSGFSFLFTCQGL